MEAYFDQFYANEDAESSETPMVAVRLENGKYATVSQADLEMMFERGEKIVVVNEDDNGNLVEMEV